MPEAAASELVFVGQARPPSWREKAGRFVKEKIIDPHTPEAHYQDIIKKYFWVTDRLEGPSLDLAQRIRPQVELAARAAGWTKTITEVYLAGCAVAFTAFLTKQGIKSTGEVFGSLARRHSGMATGTVVPLLRSGEVVATDNATTKKPTPAPKPLHLKIPHHVSSGRADGFARVSGSILGQPTQKVELKAKQLSHGEWLAEVMRSALRDFERLKPHDEVMRVAGKEAKTFGKYLKEHADLHPDQRRHAQRALAHMLQGLLSENGGAPPKKRDPKQAFLDALQATKVRGEGLSDDNIDKVFAALQQFNTLKSTT